MPTPYSVPKEFPALPQVALLNGPANGTPVLGSEINKLERAVRWIAGWQLPTMPTMLVNDPISTTQRIYTIPFVLPSVKAALRIGIKTRHESDPESLAFTKIYTTYELDSGPSKTPDFYIQDAQRNGNDVVFDYSDGISPSTPGYDLLYLYTEASDDNVARLTSISIMWIPLYGGMGPGVV